MIEYKKINDNKTSKWIRLIMVDQNPRAIPFARHYIYRINGKVYTKRTQEFLDEFNKARAWWKLSPKPAANYDGLIDSL